MKFFTGLLVFAVFCVGGVLLNSALDGHGWVIIAAGSFFGVFIVSLRSNKRDDTDRY